jgi:hypothetical protein
VRKKTINTKTDSYALPGAFLPIFETIEQKRMIFFIIRIVLACVITFTMVYQEAGIWTCILFILLYVFLEVNSYITGMTHNIATEMEACMSKLQSIHEKEIAARTESYERLIIEFDKILKEVERIKQNR